MSLDQQIDRRDLAPVEPLLPVLAAIVRRYFRTEVEGLQRIPDGPTLLVGNHSGGAGSPDSVVFVLEFLDRFGVDRPLYWLAHELLMAVPGLGELLQRFGVVTASRDAAEGILRRGGSVMVYPGGEVELHRPWTARNELRFEGRTGFLRVARDTGVPLVPVVAHGGHNTYLNLTDGRTLARRLRLDRLANLKTFPVSVGMPYGIDVGGLLPHLPFPARIRIRVLEPIDVTARFGDDLQAAYGHVTGVMQRTLDELAAR